MHYSGKVFTYTLMIDDEMQAGVNSGKITYVDLSYNKTNIKLNNVRYIEDCINGNTYNTQNHLIELQAIKNGVNVAYSKTISVTSAVNSNAIANWQVLTDGDITSANYAQSSVSRSLQSITVDLEDTYNLDEIAVSHYWSDGRSYNNHSLYVSSDNTNWTTLIDNVSGVTETPNGIIVNAWD